MDVVQHENVLENVSFNFAPNFEIMESDKNNSKWIKIGGTALTEGVSRNNNHYTFDNLVENNGRNFKFLVGHPDEAEDHVVGKGVLTLDGSKLLHEGKIRNTARHPDVVEKVQDGLLGPSIHATAKKVMREDNGNFRVEGLSIDGVGLVVFQGVKNASIDYAIAESFEKKMKESDDGQNNDKKCEVDNMSEEEVKQDVPEEKPVEEPKAEEQPAPEAPAEAPAEEQKEDAVAESVKALKEELDMMKKEKIVESILSVNSELDKSELMKESIEVLKVKESYELKLVESAKPLSVSEEDEAPVEGEEVVADVEEKDGNVTLKESAYKKFNEEIRAKVR